MKSKRQHEHGQTRSRLVGVLWSSVALFALWFLLTGNASRSELILGLASTAGTATVLWSVLATQKLRMKLLLGDLALCWRLPGEILTDCWLVTVVLAKDLLGIERAGSFYRACGFRSSTHQPLLVGRSALAILYTTMSPNMLSIGIDPHQSLMVFHQLKRTKLPDTACHLGAQR